MTKATHTPGPWHIEKSRGNRFVVRDKDNNVPGVCTVYDYGEHGPAEINARLIAAAPDLLEACKAISHEWDQQYDGTTTMISIPVEVIEKVDREIRKAEGGEA